MTKRRLKNPKRKGITFENRVRRHLEGLGWFVVRQASSTFPDLIAIPPVEQKKRRCNFLSGNGRKIDITVRPDHLVYAIECKYRKDYITPDEIIRLESLQKSHRIVAVLAYVNDDKSIGLEYVRQPLETDPFVHPPTPHR